MSAEADALLSARLHWLAAIKAEFHATPEHKPAAQALVKRERATYDDAIAAYRRKIVLEGS